MGLRLFTEWLLCCQLKNKFGVKKTSWCRHESCAGCCRTRSKLNAGCGQFRRQVACSTAHNAWRAALPAAVVVLSQHNCLYKFCCQGALSSPETPPKSTQKLEPNKAGMRSQYLTLSFASAFYGEVLCSSRGIPPV